MKEMLEDLKDHNRLRNSVIDYYIDECSNYDSPDELLTSLEDLMTYGCSSGMINNLIYYDDTQKFYKEYQEEINEELSSLISNTGLTMEELFGKEYDREDPLILDYHNQNLLAWFGFEEAARKLYDDINEIIKYKENAYEWQ